MIDYEPTDEQAEMLLPNALFVTACPGAGKTQTLVKRHEHLWSQRQRGVALLSFTTRAVHEMTSRLSHQPRLLHSPNYVGTFDSFIRDFVARPSYIRENGTIPRFIDSWKDLEDRSQRELSVRLGQGRWDSIPLEHFYWEEANLVIDQHGRTGRYRSVIENIGAEKLTSAAQAQIQQLIQRGIFDCSTARFYAMRKLQSSNKLTDRISRRFEEIMIDEFQDCDEVEHQIIALLREAGIAVTVVSDPNQMIYEFRGASPVLFERFALLYQPPNVVFLTKNFRSSSAICDLANSLAECFSHPSMTAAGRHAKDPTPILLLSGDVDKCRLAFSQEADDLGLPPDGRIVLAHRWSDAAKLGRSIAPPRDFRGQLGDQIAALSANILSRQTTSFEKSAQIRVLQDRLLMVFDWNLECKLASQNQKLQLLARTADWLRIMASRILLAYNPELDAHTYAKLLRGSIQTYMNDEKIPLAPKLHNVVKCTQQKWTILQNSERRPGTSLRISSIHSAKGTEYDGVLLNVDSSAIQHWRTNKNDETIRLLYVGATRAKRLLGLFANKDPDARQIEARLTHDEVPFDHINCS